MSQLKFFALGGLGENGKNMYVIECAGGLYIFDCGIKYPGNNLYGVDEIIPEYRMLLNAKKRIKGVFLSHAHEDHIGGLPYFLKDINVPIYGSLFTTAIVEELLDEHGFDFENTEINVVDQNDVITFGEVKISFFSVAHSIPGALGIVIDDGANSLVYTGNFTFDQNPIYEYQTSFKRLHEIAEKGVTVLLTESLGSGASVQNGTNEALNHHLDSIFTNTSGRIIAALFASDLRNIQRMVELSLSKNKKIAILGKKARKIIEIARELGYLKIPQTSFVDLKYLDEKTTNDYTDLVVLVAGNRHDSFYSLQRMAKGLDRLIKITSKDTIILMTPAVPGTEKMAAKTLDILYRSEATIKNIDRKMMVPSHATIEELKMLINILQPLYIVPVIGEYRHQFWLQKIAKELRYKDDKILLLDSGDVVTIQDDECYIGYKDIATGEILIDGTPLEDSNDLVMKDREILAEDGCLIFVAHINVIKKSIISDFEIITSGFVYHKESEEILKKIKEIGRVTIEKTFTEKNTNWNELKKDLRDAISKYVYQETRSSPLTIPVVIPVNK